MFWSSIFLLLKVYAVYIFFWTVLIGIPVIIWVKWISLSKNVDDA